MTKTLFKQKAIDNAQNLQQKLKEKIMEEHKE